MPHRPREAGEACSGIDGLAGEYIVAAQADEVRDASGRAECRSGKIKLRPGIEIDSCGLRDGDCTNKIDGSAGMVENRRAVVDEIVAINELHRAKGKSGHKGATNTVVLYDDPLIREERRKVNRVGEDAGLRITLGAAGSDVKRMLYSLRLCKGGGIIGIGDGDGVRHRYRRRAKRKRRIWGGGDCADEEASREGMTVWRAAHRGRFLSLHERGGGRGTQRPATGRHLRRKPKRPRPPTRRASVPGSDNSCSKRRDAAYRRWRGLN